MKIHKPLLALAAISGVALTMVTLQAQDDEPPEMGVFITSVGLGEPEDIADVIAFLVSNASRYITGQIITVDGGLLVGRY